MTAPTSPELKPRGDNADVRLGGVYSLGMLAEESIVHRQAVGDVLSSFVRNHSPWPPDPSSPRPGMDNAESQLAELRVYAPDVQAAMTTLGKHTAPWYDVDGLRFRYCDLRRVNLSGSQFASATKHAISLSRNGVACHLHRDIKPGPAATGHERCTRLSRDNVLSFLSMKIAQPSPRRRGTTARMVLRKP